MTSNTKPSICIIAQNAYGVLADVDTGHVGGIEVQTPLMAKWLASQGYKVTMVTWDEGIDDAGSVGDVRVCKMCKRTDGVRILRFFYPRWTSLISALKCANADIYYYNCGDLTLGQIVAWAKFNRKQVVYSVANERDCYRDLSHLESFRDRHMYQYGLVRVDKVIVQTTRQQNLLSSEYNLKAHVIPMPCEGFSELARTSADRLSDKKIRILWVGRITTEKRVEWLLDVAEACPDLWFDVIGSENEPSSYAKSIVERAKGISNVEMHGRVSHADMGEYYKNATLLCSTSVYEGFPNVYLEAWSTGLPIVSTFDPDGVIGRFSLGFVTDNVEQLIASIRKITTREEHEKASSAAIDYFVTHHAVNASMKLFAKAFDEMV